MRTFKTLLILILSMNLLFNPVIGFAEMPSPSGGMSGGGEIGGGGGGGGFYNPTGISSYILSPEGEVYEEQPTTGTEVKLVIQATRSIETKPVYMIAIYNADGQMETVQTFETKTTELYQHDFFEFSTTYDTSKSIRVFTLDSTDKVTPLRDVAHCSFYDYYSALPEQEEEKEGVIAYQGYPYNITPTTFTLDVFAVRSNGYWSNFAPEEDILVHYSNQDICIASCFFNTVYNIEKVDGKYILVDMDTEYETITVTSDMISSVFWTTITISNGENETTYPMSPEAYFFENNAILANFTLDYFRNQDATYTLALIDGKVAFLNSRWVDKSVGKVSSIARGEIIISYFGIDAENAVFIDESPVVDDVIEITRFGDKFYIEVLDFVYGTLVIDGENLAASIDGTIYPLDSNIEINRVGIGETCRIYFDSTGKSIAYIDKAYEKKEIIIVTGITITDDDDTCTLTTNKDTITFSLEDYIVFNGMLTKGKDIAYSIDFESFVPLYYEKTDEYLTLEYLTDPYNEFEVSVPYRAGPEMFGNFALTEDTLIAAYREGYGFIDEFTLQGNISYQAKVFSKNGMTADVIILYLDNSASTQTTMIVTEIDEDSVHGYINGELTTYVLNDDMNLSISSGDFIKILHFGDMVIGVEILCSVFDGPLHMVPSNTYARSIMVDGRVVHLMDTILSIDNGATQTMIRTNSDTNYYIYNLDEGVIMPCESSEILVGDHVILHASWQIATDVLIIL